MKTYRTPDHRFEGLPDWPFAPHYTELTSGLRIHHVDEGPRTARPVLMMHGEPSWSYLYRKMIGPVVEAGYRVLAPDLPGFGRSDKPLSRSDFTYAAMVAWMREWVEAVDLKGAILVCQDWGSLIGLRVLAEVPDRFSAVVLSNGGLPAGQTPPRAFVKWRKFANWSPVFPIGGIVQRASRRALSDAEVAAYDAPFPVRKAKAGARILPSLVPMGENVAVPDQQRAWGVLEHWDKPFRCCFSDKDPITRGGHNRFIDRVPGARDQSHGLLRGGHFIQEDDPDGFVAHILDVAEQVDAKG